jgi:hypothetical protein
MTLGGDQVRVEREQRLHGQVRPYATQIDDLKEPVLPGTFVEVAVGV